MEETMNTEIEVTTEVSEPEEVSTEISIEEMPAGPSKGFVALVAGGIAAVAIGATIAIKRHKKKKAVKKAQTEVETDPLDDEEEMYVADLDEDEPEETEKTTK